MPQTAPHASRSVRPPPSSPQHAGATTSWTLTRIAADGEAAPVTRVLANEVPIAIDFNGIGYAVLMATPADLTDLAYGFAHAERLIDDATDIVGVEAERRDTGVLLRIAIVDRLGERIVARVRHRVAESSCGLCGIENLDQAIRPLPPVASRSSRNGRGDIPGAGRAARPSAAQSRNGCGPRRRSLFGAR